MRCFLKDKKAQDMAIDVPVELIWILAAFALGIAITFMVFYSKGISAIDFVKGLFGV